LTKTQTLLSSQRLDSLTSSCTRRYTWPSRPVPIHRSGYWRLYTLIQIQTNFYLFFKNKYFYLIIIIIIIIRMTQWGGAKYPKNCPVLWLRYHVLGSALIPLDCRVEAIIYIPMCRCWFGMYNYHLPRSWCWFGTYNYHLPRSWCRFGTYNYHLPRSFKTLQVNKPKETWLSFFFLIFSTLSL